MSENPYYERNIARLANRTVEHAAELERIERDAIANFSGQLDELSSAIGMLRMGDHFGWKVLVLIHNKRTIRKYEKILGISVREFFPEEGPSWERSRGYKFIKNIGNFWKGVSGDIKVENRREIEK
jgi:hypothetical protein